MNDTWNLNEAAEDYALLEKGIRRNQYGGVRMKVCG